MKIRTDFVTNSSSSSFVLMLQIDLKDGKEFIFRGVGSCGEGGPTDFDELNVTVSPRELGNAESVDMLIAMLKDGVMDGTSKIFDRSDAARQCELERLKDLGCVDMIRMYGRAAEFADSLSLIPDMDEIRSITVTGNEYGQPYNYLRTFTYNRETGEYIMNSRGMEFEKDGGSGGDLQFQDAYLASMFLLTDVDFINFKERTFVLTGFSEQKKLELCQLIESKGGYVGESINKQVQYLVVNTSYGHPTRKYNDAISANVDEDAWYPYNVAIVDEATLREFAALPSGQVREGGSPLRFSNDRKNWTGDRFRKELVDVSHTLTDLTVEDSEKVHILACALTGIEMLDTVTFGENVVLNIDIAFPVKHATLGDPQLLARFVHEQMPEVNMPVVSLDLFTKQKHKFCAVHNYLRKTNAGEQFDPAIAKSYNAYMKLNRKALLAQTNGIQVIRCLAQNDLLPAKEATELLLREDVQADATLCALFSGLKKTKAHPETTPDDKLWTKQTKEIVVHSPETGAYSLFGRKIKSKVARLYKGLETDVVVPSQIKGEPVSVLGEFALSPLAEGLTPEQIDARRKLKKVTISEGICYIYLSAFRGCDDLEELILPEGIIEVLSAPQDHASNILSKVPTAQRKYLYPCTGAFRCCSFDEVLEVPDGVEAIGYDAFEQSSGLQIVVLPETVKHILKNAFLKCSDLKQIDFPEGLCSIEDFAFRECKALAAVKIPASLQKMGCQAFAYCEKLEKVKLQDGLRVIGDSAFCNCTGLQEISIPASVQAIASDAFAFCERLHKVELHEGLLSIDSCAFGWCENLREISIPASVHNIHQNAFACKSSNLTVYAKHGSYAENRMEELGYHVVSV